MNILTEAEIVENRTAVDRWCKAAQAVNAAVKPKLTPEESQKLEEAEQEYESAYTEVVRLIEERVKKYGPPQGMN